MNSSKTSQLLIFTSAMKQYMLDIQETHLEIFQVQKNVHKLEKRINFLDYKYSFDQEDGKLLVFKGNKVFYDFQTQTIPQDKLVLFISKLNIKMARHNWNKDVKVIQVIKQTKNSKIILVQIQNQYRVHKVINVDTLQDEIKILQILAANPHKNILNMERFYFHEEDIYIQFPYIKDGTLYSLLGENPQGLPEEQIQDVMAQILDVINHIHSLGILHKDIKFDNILIEKGQIKIIDFGLAALKENWDHRCGTCGYMAPEIFEEVSLNEKIDVYSVGVIFHKLLCGRSLYSNLQENQSGNYRINKKIQDFETIDLLHNMLNKNPKLRFSASDCLAHPFFIKESNLEYQIRTLQMPQLKTPFQNVKQCQQRGSESSQNSCSTNVLDQFSFPQ